MNSGHKCQVVIKHRFYRYKYFYVIYSRIDAIFEEGSSGPNLLGLGAKENSPNLKMINISDYVFRDILLNLLRSIRAKNLMKEKRRSKEKGKI